jgi:uncharacterized damage-inducible protein DinB
MNDAPQPAIRLALPWLNMTFDGTERAAAALTDELRDWRPEDPSGHFVFSLGEIVAHLADERRMFARRLSGEDSEDGYWGEGPAADGVWKFRPLPSAAELLADLKAARAQLQPWLDRPVAELWQIPDGSRKLFAKQLEQLRAEGGDVASHELRGPANLNRILFAVACHEQSHRGVLHICLRMNGAL